MKSTVNAKTLGSAAALALLLAAGCGSHLQQTSGSVTTGAPPICFQYRSEARPAPGAIGQSNIWLMANNTCSYTMDCMVWDDVTEKQNRIVLPAYGTNSYLLALNQQANRVSTKLDCSWVR
jgi:hypothetical protein